MGGWRTRSAWRINSSSERVPPTFSSERTAGKLVLGGGGGAVRRGGLGGRLGGGGRRDLREGGVGRRRALAARGLTDGELGRRGVGGGDRHVLRLGGGGKHSLEPLDGGGEEVGGVGREPLLALLDRRTAREALEDELPSDDVPHVRLAALGELLAGAGRLEQCGGELAFGRETEDDPAVEDEALQPHVVRLEGRAPLESEVDLPEVAGDGGLPLRPLLVADRLGEADAALDPRHLVGGEPLHDLDADPLLVGRLGPRLVHEVRGDERREDQLARLGVEAHEGAGAVPAHPHVAAERDVGMAQAPHAVGAIARGGHVEDVPIVEVDVEPPLGHGVGEVEGQAERSEGFLDRAVIAPAREGEVDDGELEPRVARGVEDVGGPQRGPEGLERAVEAGVAEVEKRRALPIPGHDPPGDVEVLPVEPSGDPEHLTHEVRHALQVLDAMVTEGLELVELVLELVARQVAVGVVGVLVAGDVSLPQVLEGVPANILREEVLGLGGEGNGPVGHE